MRLYILYTALSALILLSMQCIQNKPTIVETDKDTLSTMNYEKLRAQLVQEYAGAAPGKWGEFVKGTDQDLITNTKIIALTFDACGTKYGDGYDEELVNFLKKEKIPATMFFTGLWIDANPEVFKQLTTDTLFEIENHGLRHKPCASDGETEYGIKGTLNIGEAIDEIELNNRKIKSITGRRPKFFRSPTAFIDETCVKVAGQLGITVISYDVLSGDAVPETPEQIIAGNILKNVKDGTIVIMHMNHPKWYTYEALLKVVPELRKQGYSFVKLEHHRLRNKSVKN
jgi:peptidoglycan/xylan/chitin deacetylase (PgdA/CDA1 family)